MGMGRDGESMGFLWATPSSQNEANLKTLRCLMGWVSEFSLPFLYISLLLRVSLPFPIESLRNFPPPVACGNQWTIPSLCCWPTDIIVVCSFFPLWRITDSERLHAPFCKSTSAASFLLSDYDILWLALFVIFKTNILRWFRRMLKVWFALGCLRSSLLLIAWSNIQW